MLFVEPTNVCNFRCPICPESLPDYQEKAGYWGGMAPATWQRVRESMTGWARLKTIRFYHTGEPLLNPNLPAMVAEAREFSERTEITTNGSLLTPKRAGDLMRAGLDYLRVSVYGTTPEAYARETGAYRSLDRVIGNVEDLRRLRAGARKPHIHAELVTRETGQEKEFIRQWHSIADELSVKALHNWGDALVKIGAKPKKKVCPYPFYELAVKANGDVSVCCVDWANQLIVGSVLTHTLKQIWEGDILAELRHTHLRGERGRLAACRECNVPDTCPDNLDSLCK